MSTATPERHTPEADEHLRLLLHSLCTTASMQSTVTETFAFTRKEISNVPAIPGEIMGDIPSPFERDAHPRLVPIIYNTKPKIIATENIAPQHEAAAFRDMQTVREMTPHIDDDTRLIGTITLRDTATCMPPLRRFWARRVATDLTYFVHLDIGSCGEKTYPITREVTRSFVEGQLPLDPYWGKETELEPHATVLPSELPPLNSYIIDALFAAETSQFVESLKREL